MKIIGIYKVTKETQNFKRRSLARKTFISLENQKIFSQEKIILMLLPLILIVGKDKSGLVPGDTKIIYLRIMSGGVVLALR